MSLNIDPIDVKRIRAVGNRLLVTDINFDEQQTQAGIIITSDNGKPRGIHPRWGKVYTKGPLNNDDYEIGDWVLIEHGRWTRSFKISTNNSEPYDVWMVESESVLGFSDKKPNDIQF